MKKIFIIALALLMLCSCAMTEKTPKEPEQPKIDIGRYENSSGVPNVFIFGDVPLEKFGYSFDEDNGDGTRTNVIACGIHPLQCETLLNVDMCFGEKIEFTFEREPVSYSLVRYAVEENRNYEFTGNEVSVPVETENNAFAPQKGEENSVYVLNVKYPDGECEYAFEVFAHGYAFDRFVVADIMEDEKLLLADSDGIMTLSFGNIPVFLDGEPADASVIKDGMQADIKHSGLILASDPGMFGNVFEIHVYSRGTKNDPMGTYFDICGLYLDVLMDLWQADAGLNDGAEIVNIDLSNAPGKLSEGQKQAVTYMFMQEMKKAQTEVKHAVSLTREELEKQGYLSPYGENENALWFENGISLSITEFDYGEEESDKPNAVYSLPVVNFNATKWRSPLGAYVFYDCKAVWPQNGTWSEYTIGSEMIS